MAGRPLPMAAAPTLPQGLSLTHYQDAEVASQFSMLARLGADVLTQFDPDVLSKRFRRYSGWALHLVATQDAKPVAFKLGHAEGESAFYSWLGGVAPDWRGHGLAAALMQAQHEWARAQGYRKVTTRTRKDNARMAQINLAAGFVETGLLTKDDGRVMRCFVKSLV
ncbi:GNAT family N-acetyltransferase [Alterisphingorhabdus coralli]|uniref:GNAT family N-acetyltransferase n=1 Tax=Alterisphingorhabdus coralli TaxID=3071408 RepID=A0AA97F683_9SPHN|nr:GNAT family N-acetyltransferase [Parasphingorhabdus sp. SCSIO 66989]WOE75149.1 GNAT family N-acetyltransferase [Parasphingorhabdus sp. SCSIO 66989]